MKPFELRNLRHDGIISLTMPGQGIAGTTIQLRQTFSVIPLVAAERLSDRIGVGGPSG